MTDPGLIQALDYILNHSDDASLDALAEAVVRRRRDLTIFNTMGNIPDPQSMAKDLSNKINSGIGDGIEGMKKSIREMIVRVVRENAPELTDAQIDELSQAWLPEQSAKEQALPREVLSSMIEQFVAFSRGEMQKKVDKNLRDEMGAWPERYWKAFPPVIRQVITDFLKGKTTEKNFNSQIEIALGK